MMTTVLVVKNLLKTLVKISKEKEFNISDISTNNLFLHCNTDKKICFQKCQNVDVPFAAPYS